MLPVAEQMDKVGYYALEVWGGATFDSCLRYLNEDPWERLRAIRKAIPNTKLQMLLRGQNLLGYKHYADDVVDLFCKKAIENGIDIIRIFDALNDPRNVETAVKATKKYGGTAEVAFSYTTSKVHTIDYFVELAKKYEEMGADIICIKDMANLLLPYDAYELVSKLKANLKEGTQIHLHTHNTAGTGDMTNLKAIEAGCDIVDTALSPLGNGTSQPSTEALVATLKGTKYDTGINLEDLNVLTKHFTKVAQRLTDDGFLSSKVLKVDINALIYQVPGGMLSNLISQLKMAGKSELLEAVLEEVANVRRDAGYPPLVTPTSQIVGTQAVNNVIFASEGRYARVTKEFRALVRGEYGRCPAPISEDFKQKIIGDDPIIDYRPADKIAPEMDSLRSRVERYKEQDEDVLSLALFETVAIKFFEWRKQQKYNLDPNATPDSGVHSV